MDYDLDKVCYNDFVANLCKAGDVVLADLTADTAHIAHMAMGVADEMFELLEAIENNDIKNIVEECGDIEFYLQGYCNLFGFHISRTHSVLNVSINDEIESNPIEHPASLSKTVEILRKRVALLVSLSKKRAIYNDPNKTPELRKALIGCYFALDNYYVMMDLNGAQVIYINKVKLKDRYGSKLEEGEQLKFNFHGATTRPDKLPGE